MKVSINIPESIVKHLKDEGYSEVQIQTIFIEYLEFYINEIPYTSLDGFKDWMEQHFEEE